jgi:amino acid transporter
MSGGLALYVQMGASLPKGGPAGLFLGFVLYGTIVLAVNQCFGLSSSLLFEIPGF